MDPAGLPVITYADSISIHFNGEEIRVMHTPAAHTDGDSFVHFVGSNVIHAGDLLFSGLFPFVDLEGGGSVDGYLEGLEKILDVAEGRDGVRIIAGHGPLSTPEDLRASRDMILKTRALVRERMKAGKDLAAIQEEGLPEEWSSWSWEFIDTAKWLATLHQDASQDAR